MDSVDDVCVCATGHLWGYSGQRGLYRTTDLRRTFTTREDDVRQLGGGLWGETWLRPSPRLRLNLGLRADYYSADVSAFRPVNSGSASEWMLNPKATLVWSASELFEIYLNAGSGFHSNDARGATIRVDPASGEPVNVSAPLDDELRGVLDSLDRD